MDYSMLRGANPWQKVADEWLCKLRNGATNFEYILSEDDLALQSYSRSLKARQKLVLDIPPQPFVGRPEANIWLLLNNSGTGGVWDRCDYLNGSKALPTVERQCASAVADTMLGVRQKLYHDQLKLAGSEDNAFILMNPAFRTAAQTGRLHAKNIYTWYHAQLFPRNGVFTSCVDVDDFDAVYYFVSRNLFVLDYFPYRSHAYDRDSPIATHARFWSLLLKEAFEDEGKLLIMRKWIRDVILQDEELVELYRKAKEGGRIIVAAHQRLWFTDKNLGLIGGWWNSIGRFVSR